MKKLPWMRLLVLALLALSPWLAQAAPDMPAITTTNTGRGTQYSLTLQLLALMTTLSLLPSLLLMMTAFVRIVIVMSILRQALGTGQTPPNLVLTGLALRADHRVISLIAGLDHGQIARWTGAGRVCRAIPLPFVAQGRDATPVFPPDPEAVALFGALGQALPVATQRDFDAFAALSALMASFFGIAEIASDWGARQGLTPDQSRAYVGQLFGNLGEVLRQDPLAVERLRAEHATRGGLNEQLFAEFRSLGGEAALQAGLDGILRRVSPGRG